MQVPKYSVRYKGQTYVGNAKEIVANNISKDHGISFAKAVLHVNSNIIPIVRSQAPEFNPVEKHKLTLDDIVSGGKAVVKNIKGETVDQQAINTRAAICTDCPHRSQVQLCSSCGAARKLVKFANFCKSLFSSAAYTIPNNLDGHYCGVCNCALSVLLPAKQEHISLATKTDPERPDFCWIKRGL